MFTGIVQTLGVVAAFERSGDLAELRVDVGERSDGVQLGASIAINGVCLTVTGIEHPTVLFDVAAESLRLTNLGEIQVGDRVNVERSFRIGDEVGGHVLSGHVIGTARLLARRDADGQSFIDFKLPEPAMPYVFHKGFIALDGASLTVAALDQDSRRLSVNLIPETLERTRFGWLQVGASINVEVDAQTQATVETVRRLFAAPDFVRSILPTG